MTDTMTAATQLDDLISGEYRHGFITDVAADALPRGLSEDVVRLISAKKNEPPFMLEWRLAAFRHWLTMKEPNWATVRHPADRLSGHHLLLGAEVAEGRPEKPRRRRSRTAARLREARHSAAGTRDACRRRGRRGLRQRVGRHDVQGKLGEARHHLLLVLRSRAGTSGPREAISRVGRSVHRQLLRGAELRRVQRRLVLLHPERRALSDGAVDVFPHQCQGHRSVRAHADHRRRRRVRQLSRRLHRADARRESAARGSRRTDRARQTRASSIRRCRTGIRATRRARAASTTSSPSAATAAAPIRRFPGRRSRRARRSRGSIRAASCSATTRSASSIRSQ